MKYLSDALRHNKVQLFIHSFYHFHFYYFIQTIIQLSLHHNHIGDEGAKYLRDLLINNQVNTNVLFSFFHSLFIIS
jgi:hypothetical protein